MPQIISVGARIEHPRQYYGRYQIGPLRRGQAITLGNSLRRILLGDLSGLAITSARILGVSHEFATLSGVRESALEILFNLQGIVLTGDASLDPSNYKGLLMAKGPGRIQAKDLSLPEGVRVVDPEQHIATLSEGATLQMKVRLEKGAGYRIRSNHPNRPSAPGVLIIDPIFMPVRQVNYKVQEVLRYGFMQEILLLEVWTNGSITPRHAIHEAATVLVRLGLSLRKRAPQVEVPTPKIQTKTRDVFLDQSIEILELSVRASHCLEQANIRTVRQLIQYSIQDLLKLRNFGQKSAQEVIEVLASRGLKLAS